MPHNLIPIATYIILFVVVLIGGIVAIVHPATLPFSDYVKDVGLAAGLLAVGRGLDAHSKV